MAWTAEVTGKTWQDGLIYVDIRYTDGTRVITERHRVAGSLPEEWLQKTAAAKITALTAVDSATIAVGPISAPSPPSGDVAFMNLVRKASRVADLVKLGVLAANDARVVALADEIRTNLATYWDKI